MRKILAITWKELYTRFTDRNLLIIMIVTPLALSTIVGLVFGGLGGNDVPFEEIPVAIINTDQGNELGINYGDVITGVFIPGESEALDSLPACDLSGGDTGSTTAADTISLDELTDAVVFDAALAGSLVDQGDIEAPGDAAPGSQEYIESAGRAAVDNGLYTALILIPPDFSAYFSSDGSGVAPVITVYANAGKTVTAGIIHSIVEGIVNRILAGQITIEATFSEIATRYGPQAAAQTASSIDFNSSFACAFSSDANTIQIDSQSISGAGGSSVAGMLVAAGASQAMFFALFTAQFGVLSMYDERSNWTLQRLLVSPTPRSSILAGKFFGVFVSIVFQLLLLMVLLTLVGSIMQGELIFIWGDQPLKVLLLLLVASLAVAGFGMFMAAIAKTPEQGGVFGSVANMTMAALGGAFGFTLPRSVAMFSIVYWGREAFERLAAGQGDITLHLLVLLIQGAVMYAVGVWLFNRRMTV